MLIQMKIIGTAVVVVCALAAVNMAPPARAMQTASGTGSEKGTAWPWPLIGEIATAYRNGSDPYAAGQHRGVDIAAPVGTPARAVASGIVAFSGKLPDGGNAVTLRTADDEYLISFLHLRERTVRRGADVSVGDTLGTVGTTGKRSIERSHLHLGVRVAATRKYVDPMGLLGEPIVAAPVAAQPEEAQPRAIKIVPLEAAVESRSSAPAEVRATEPLEAKSNAATNGGSRVSSEGRAASTAVKAPAPASIDAASSDRSATPQQFPARQAASRQAVAPVTEDSPMPIRAVLLSLAALAFAALLVNRRPRRAPESSKPPAVDSALEQPAAEVVELSEAVFRSR